MTTTRFDRLDDIPVGERVLWKGTSVSNSPCEAVVEEVSPSGDYVCLGDSWHDTSSIYLFEVLDEPASNDERDDAYITVDPRQEYNCQSRWRLAVCGAGE